VQEVALSSGVTFTNESRNDASCRILCIKRETEFLTARVVLLFQGEDFQYEGIPFILKGMKKGWN
jgi:hypothetical protein